MDPVSLLHKLTLVPDPGQQGAKEKTLYGGHIVFLGPFEGNLFKFLCKDGFCLEFDGLDHKEIIYILSHFMSLILAHNNCCR